MAAPLTSAASEILTGGNGSYLGFFEFSHLEVRR